MFDTAEKAEIEQAAISEYAAGEIGPKQFSDRLRRAGLTPQAIELALRIYRPKTFKPYTA